MSECPCNDTGMCTNTHRAQRAKEILGLYGAKYDESANDQERLNDLLSDLRHLCDQRGPDGEDGLDFEDAVISSDHHFVCEIGIGL